ncbi:bifunctional 2-C-methyl-D-erythritol 4-phosphate cytidylyltransferase/2-C-methyl-D-erythritol 2,4-cyclodiphosphate synthase [Sphingomonas sp.]|uniref:bifunctional 2-C-methyl-D-erythritol 4-phosphate cytidylyltransferase/2-C-methyl-D-erythritol 2,4-cyclodiphosphate synthase n=1 Tax=Sphingomonas sp. TaxID=28214 RepID=UPI002BB7790C|nr:bifunctional 2-C-methyl-D-erythritol 4-phosphate cytidylyltransferase/2-C-methyl-D-erythritol 2,4-cyclodiphosphate synthase [Sphingomonas sp.]HTG38387.1 bifunctional 2-C-methyl-D-erythritol 4-phosphate cytidylyltransferase/2-C-methyl-D-erythritol 2,4-cyclodiphosphate synthase [Sphingomonas sp.]
MDRAKTAALIVAAGQGTRMGAPKQFRLLGGRVMLAWSHATFSAHPGIDHVLVVIADGQQAALAEALGDVAFVTGGATRQASVRNGLVALAAAGFDRVLVHDAARPFVPDRVIDALIAALDTDAGATPALPVADTLARGIDVLGDTVDRKGLYRIQTPQAFALAELIAAHDAWPHDADATDDAQMLRRAGHVVALVEGDPMLEKITWPADAARAEAMLGAQMVSRSASGFDVHRLEAGEELWLGGILIPHDRGLSGHSDADVALHAITDALLGTIAAGDIGQHFPPSDPQWKGANSAQFLEHAAALVAQRGGVIDFVDLTLMCEAPKIGPHREAMRARIADLLRLHQNQVSVKATTTERLGFTGRGEGIAAQALATVRVPVTRENGA